MSKTLCPKVLHNYERQGKALEISFSCHVTLHLGVEREEQRTSDTTKTNSPSNIYFTLKAGKTLAEKYLTEFWIITLHTYKGNTCVIIFYLSVG
jgi:hypothetical protein